MSGRNQPNARADETAASKAEMDWDKAERRPGRPAGTVVSVRLDSDETARLHDFAASLGLSMSQVLRQALTSFDPETSSQVSRRWALSPFTFGGAAWIGQVAVMEGSEKRTDLSESPSKTIDTRVRELLPG